MNNVAMTNINSRSYNVQLQQERKTPGCGKLTPDSMDSHHGFIVQNPSPFQPKPGLLDSGYKHKFPMLHPYSQPDNRMSPQDSRDSQSDSLMCQLDSRNSQSERRIDPHDSRDSQSVPRMRQIDGRNDLPDSKTNPYRSEESQVDFQAKSPNDNFQRNSVDKSQHEERDVEVRTNLFESFKSDSFDPGSRERGDDIRRQSDDNDKKSQNSISVKEQQSDSRRKQKWNYEKMPDFGKEEKSEAGKSSVNKSNVVKGVGNLTLVKEKGKKSILTFEGVYGALCQHGSSWEHVGNPASLNTSGTITPSACSRKEKDVEENDRELKR
ncbi:hypothetical protein MAR_005771 [Mya arenaria]|uniref:Uncharacterized protein n=1 Tax=Mya arenaria TaxID=6604 RepID=A0ABY7F4D6_MYAAR|nr:hypothetical protein MAR_005771 [Mya arenaria]